MPVIFPAENTSIFTFFEKCKTNIFKICSYIKKKTQNLINALEMTIYDTNHTNNTQTYFIKPHILFEHFENIETLEKHLFIISKFHNSYFVYFVYFPASGKQLKSKTLERQNHRRHWQH